MYGTPQREVVFDLNDFDETIMGPWEWDLKRLVASGENPIAKADPKSKAVFRKTLAKAMHTDNHALMPKVADRKSNGSWAFRDDPPVLTRAEKSTKQKVIDALNRYSLTLPRERRVMLGHYHVGDVAHRVVGVGSDGTRAYLALLFGNGETDPLFLQVKEAIAPAHLPFLPPLLHEFRHHGKRMVMGQRALPASSDPMLGFRRSTDGISTSELANESPSATIRNSQKVTQFVAHFHICHKLS